MKTKSVKFSPNTLYIHLVKPGPGRFEQTQASCHVTKQHQVPCRHVSPDVSGSPGPDEAGGSELAQQLGPHADHRLHGGAADEVLLAEGALPALVPRLLPRLKEQQRSAMVGDTSYDTDAGTRLTSQQSDLGVELDGTDASPYLHASITFCELGRESGTEVLLSTLVTESTLSNDNTIRMPLPSACSATNLSKIFIKGTVPACKRSSNPLKPLRKIFAMPVRPCSATEMRYNIIFP